MPRADLERFGPYGFAVVVTAAGLLITLLLTRLLEDFPLLILLSAVMASGLRGGRGPGLFATVLSIVSVAVVHVLGGGFAWGWIDHWDEYLRFTVFMLLGAGISMTAGAQRRAEGERDALLVSERRARADAEAANQAKDHFLAAVSHELRGPLAPIVSWTSLLRAGALDEGCRLRALDVIAHSAKVQAQLIDDLLDVSRIVAGKLRVDTRPVEMRAVVEAALETVRPAAEARRIAIEVGPLGPPAIVMGDPDRLQQVAWNLLSNAIKFTPEGGRVWVAMRRDTHVVLEVGDTGRGIAPDMLPHVFERFWQAEDGTMPRSGGLGLGLAIVRHLVELHGGTVSARSQGTGRGAVFRVAIPACDGAEPGGVARGGDPVRVGSCAPDDSSSRRAGV